MRRLITAFVALATLLTSGLAGGHVRAGGDGSTPPSDHHRVVSFWTPARQAGATERTVTMRGHAQAKSKPGGPIANAWSGGEPVSITAGRVFFTARNTTFSCSGSVIHTEVASVVMTAGHCAFDVARNVWASNWMFVPGWTGPNDPMPLGAWTATDLFTTRTWWESGSYDDDVAFAVVIGDEGRGTLESELAGRGVAAPSVAFTAPSDGDPITAFGYPAAKHFDGNQLTFCDSSAVTGIDGTGTFAIACDMTAGASGGPWYGTLPSGADPGTIRSLTSYGYARLKGYLFGPVFDNPEFFVWNAAGRGGDCSAEEGTGYACTEMAL